MEGSRTTMTIKLASRGLMQSLVSTMYEVSHPQCGNPRHWLPSQRNGSYCSHSELAKLSRDFSYASLELDDWVEFSAL